MNLVREFHFGKIDYFGVGRSSYPVEAVAELSDTGTFSASAFIIRKGGYLVAGGQIFDLLKDFLEDNPVFQKLYRFWKLYHLNDLHAGTPAQEALLEKYSRDRGRELPNYNEATEILEYYHMRTVPPEQADPYRKPNSSKRGQPYTFGNEWLFYPIPGEDLEEIKKFLSQDTNS